MMAIHSRSEELKSVSETSKGAIILMGEIKSKLTLEPSGLLNSGIGEVISPSLDVRGKLGFGSAGVVLGCT